jgi:hypothetical protein
LIELCGRPVPANNTSVGIPALSGDEVISPRSVEGYLTQRFGEAFGAVRRAVVELAKGYTPDELAYKAFPLYERFWPEIPEGVKGWGRA